MNVRDRALTALHILLLDVRERAQFDWRPARALLCLALRLRYLAYRTARDLHRSLDTLGLAWRLLDGPRCSVWCLSKLARITGGIGPEGVGRLSSDLCVRRRDAAFGSTLRDSVVSGDQVFQHRLIVLKAAGHGQKGVLLVKYSNYFQYFLELFHPRVFDDYHVVLEPSWVGYFLPDILAFQVTSERVFVQVWEDRDLEFLASRRSNLVPVRCGPNSWIDPDVFFPVPSEKRYDLIMVAIWSDFKRHHAVFRALRRCDPRVRIACVGQPWPRTMADVQSLAQYYGVADRVDFYDSVDQAELNRLYSRSRAALLWSRKEGSNKSVIEAMLADIPVIIRHGHNYGTHYEFVNPETGVFAREEELPGLLDALHEGTFGPFAPRRWALEHWSPQRATCTVEEAIYGDCAGRLAEKVNSPDLQYRSPDAARALKPEYDVLMRYLV